MPKIRIKLKVSNPAKQDNSNYNIFVNKCLNIIRSITDTPYYVRKNIVKYVLTF